METKINIADILKDKPKGTKLYSSACGKCNLEEVYDKSFKISFYNSKFGFMNGGEGHLDKNGKLYDDGECVVFPSKEMRDWSKFAWKKGDVLVSKDNVHIIFEKFEDDTYTRFKGKHYLWKEFNVEDYNKEETKMLTSVFEKAADDVAQTYINTIEERLGGKLNLETLEIEKQLEFKDGDIVVYGKSVAICRRVYKHTLSFYVSLNEMVGLLFADEVESSEEYRFATDEDKQQLFDALAKEGKAWDAEKKAFVDLKPKWTPKPFDRVITRVNDDAIWTANIFSHIDRHGKYVTLGCISGYDHYHCLPYNEETAKLIGTTNNWEG
jgi:hypothetical protein